MDALPLLSMLGLHCQLQPTLLLLGGSGIIISPSPSCTGRNSGPHIRREYDPCHHGRPEETAPSLLSIKWTSDAASQYSSSASTYTMGMSSAACTAICIKQANCNQACL